MGHIHVPEPSFVFHVTCPFPHHGDVDRSMQAVICALMSQPNLECTYIAGGTLQRPCD